ncbi:hypothetical protein EYF80_062293 [Liparis tanakae]|uniref:Uncharacterized protein n=1 Tax=Liparis tanakae TaxID=230148 RepID=A0A4Z2EFY9_9TELE|nr:hypothetical protein EYF80_062293 [Liparis tanakae]
MSKRISSAAGASAASTEGAAVVLVTLTIWASNQAPMFRSRASTSSLIWGRGPMRRAPHGSENAPHFMLAKASRCVCVYLVGPEPGVHELRGGVGLRAGRLGRGAGGRLRLSVSGVLVGLALGGAAAGVGVGELGLLVFALDDVDGRHLVPDEQLHDVVQPHVVVEDGVAVLHLGNGAGEAVVALSTGPDGGQPVGHALNRRQPSGNSLCFSGSTLKSSEIFSRRSSTLVSFDSESTRWVSLPSMVRT